MRQVESSYLQVSLLPATEKRQDDLMHAPEEWTALAPNKERPSFKFGPLDHPSMDLMLLQVKANFSLLTSNGNCSGRPVALEEAASHPCPHRGAAGGSLVSLETRLSG